MDRDKKYVVLLNGPPKCGKDTIVSHLVPYLAFHHMKFAAPLKRMAAALLDMNVEMVEKLKDGEFDILSKEYEEEDVNFGGNKYTYGEKDTLRRLLIRISEEFLKPTYGDTFFGRIAARELRRSSYPLAIFSDSGFVSEAGTVIRTFGQQNTILIRLHRDGCNFDNDSRAYLPDIAGVNRDINNNGTIAETTFRVASAIRAHFKLTLLKELEM